MHYKNGREAKLGDPVICKDNLGAITVGKISSISASSTCNANVVTVIMGGIETLSCRTLGEMYHAEDAFNKLEESPAAT